MHILFVFLVVFDNSNNCFYQLAGINQYKNRYKAIFLKLATTILCECNNCRDLKKLTLLSKNYTLNTAMTGFYANSWIIFLNPSLLWLFYYCYYYDFCYYYKSIFFCFSALGPILHLNHSAYCSASGSIELSFSRPLTNSNIITASKWPQGC